MLYVMTSYWPFLVVSLLVGAAVGWWFQSPRSVDSITAWLERGPEGR